MSGGSYDYAFRHVEDMAGSLRLVGLCDGDCATPALRAAFRDHLFKVAKAMRAIEWNDSCDGDSEEVDLITEVLGRDRIAMGATAYLKAAIDSARDVLSLLEDKK